MNLWFSAHFLFAGLVLTSSAPTEEECGPLKTPHAPDVQSMMSGKIYFIVGYTDNDLFKRILSITDSSWIQVSKIGDDPTTFNMFESNKMGGKCLTANIPLTIDNSRATASVRDFRSDFQLLPSCAGCFAMNVSTTIRNLDNLLKLMNVTLETVPSEITAQSVYLMANRASLLDSELEHFKKQASCLGFPGEPDYLHDPEKVVCLEGEGEDMMMLAPEDPNAPADGGGATAPRGAELESQRR